MMPTADLIEEIEAHCSRVLEQALPRDLPGKLIVLRATAGEPSWGLASVYVSLGRGGSRYTTFFGARFSSNTTRSAGSSRAGSRGSPSLQGAAAPAGRHLEDS